MSIKSRLNRGPKIRQAYESEANPTGRRPAHRSMSTGCEIKNAIIESVTIDDADRGFLNAWLFLDYGGSGQGFGGYALYLPKSFSHHEIKSYAGHFIWRCMEIGGVSKWENLSGKAIRVKVDNGLVTAIGHIVREDWFAPREDFGNDIKRAIQRERSRHESTK